MTNELKDTDIKDKVPHDRDDNMMTKVKWSTETNDIDNRFLREYDNMRKRMEDRQITDYYEAQRHYTVQTLYSIEQEGRNRDMKKMKWYMLIGAQHI